MIVMDKTMIGCNWNPEHDDDNYDSIINRSDNIETGSWSNTGARGFTLSINSGKRHQLQCKVSGEIELFANSNG